MRSIDDSATVRIIQRAIDASPDRRLTFAEYMDLALYHPECGYYSRGRGLGAGGDFATSVHLCADFGETIAIQLAEMWKRLDCPERFDLVEMGAGQGILAGDVLRALRRDEPDCFATTNYRIVEKSASLKRVQQQQLAELLAESDRTCSIAWCDIRDIDTGSVTGCCFSNELLDAFPVHRVRLHDGRLDEIYVSYDATNPEAGFYEIVDRVSTPHLSEYFTEAGINLFQDPDESSADTLRTTNVRRDYPDGYTTEVNLAAKGWITEMSRILDRGYLLTIDYGYDTERYYTPARQDGTLNCYSQHQHHPNPYTNVGQQDITAHVDFGAIERWGTEVGLTTLGRTQQALFLMALGWGDRLSGLGQSGLTAGNLASSTDIAQVFQRHQVLRDLIDPQGLGGFQVLVQFKGDREDKARSTLAGFTFPAMS